MTGLKQQHAEVDAKWKSIIDAADVAADPFCLLALFRLWRSEKEWIDAQGQAQQAAQPESSNV